MNNWCFCVQKKKGNKNKVKVGSIHFTLFLLIIYLASLFISCKVEKVNVKNDLQKDQALEFVKGIGIFFGHQSVGNNILNGITDIYNAEGKSIKIESLDEEKIFNNTNIIHTRIGKNKFPISKINDFSEKLNSFSNNSIDVALMKFCYVDISTDDEVDDIYSKYVRVFEQLEAAYPDKKFIYMTIPLSSPMTGIKNDIRRMLGRLKMVDDGRTANIPRNRFNSMLRESKSKTGRLFDLAAIEATMPNGSSYLIEIDGKEYEALYPGYTWDGGHLNTTGRRFVAEKLIRFLVELDIAKDP